MCCKNLVFSGIQDVQTSRVQSYHNFFHFWLSLCVGCHFRPMNKTCTCWNCEFGVPARQRENIVAFLSAQQRFNCTDCDSQLAQAPRLRERRKHSENWADVIFFQHLAVFSISQTRLVSRKDGCSNEMLLKPVPAGAEFTRCLRRILSASRCSLFYDDLRLY